VPLPTTLQAVLRTDPDAILLVDRKGLVQSANPACAQVLGVKPSEAEGRPLSQVFGRALGDEDDREQAAASVADILAGQLESYVSTPSPVGPAALSCRLEILPIGDRTADGRANSVLVRFSDETEHAMVEAASARTRQLQDLVIRMMGHDLKAPLAVIQGSVELAEMRLARLGQDKDARAVLDDMRRIREANVGIHVLLENARAILRITAEGDARPKPSPMDLSSIVTQSLARLGPLAAAKGIHIKASVPSGVRAMAVPGFESVVQNLVDNAIKFTPRDGEIGLHLAADGPRVHREVWDSGPGVPPEKRDRLFRSFERLEEARGTEGHGLGLSIVSQMVSLCRGKVEVLGRPDGTSGAVFRIELEGPRGL
jgi:signal transduction histidine kinase